MSERSRRAGWRRRASVVALALLVGACAQRVPRPPTYADLKQGARPLEQMTAADWARSAEILDALELTPADLQAVRATGDARLITGAAIQVSWDDDNGTQLMRSALAIDPSLEMAHVSLVNRQLAQFLNDPTDADGDALRESIAELRRRAPDNALAHYLSAWQLFIDHREGESLDALRTGNAAPRYESHSRQRFLAVVDAATSVGYSRFAASHYALGLLNPMSAYSALRRLCRPLRDGTHGDAARRECRVAGARIEAASGNLLESLVGLAMQRNAVDGSGWENETEDLARIDGRRSQLMQLSDNDLDTQDLSEASWVRYFEVFSAEGEEAAVRYATEHRPR